MRGVLGGQLQPRGLKGKQKEEGGKSAPTEDAFVNTAVVRLGELEAVLGLGLPLMHSRCLTHSRSFSESAEGRLTSLPPPEREKPDLSLQEATKVRAPGC